jgi:EpsI family protein
VLSAARVPKADGPRPRWTVPLPRAKPTSRAALVLLMLLAVPAFARAVDVLRYRGAVAVVTLPKVAPGWFGPVEATCPWTPDFPGADAKACAIYESAQHGVVFVSVVAYARQSQDDELIGGDRTRPHGEWRVLERGAAATGAAPSTVMGQDVAPPTGRARWRMWHWYSVGALATQRAVVAKAAEAFVLLPTRPPSLTVIAAPCATDCAGADAALAAYLAAHGDLANAVTLIRPEPGDAPES